MSMDYEKVYKEALERARGHHGVAINYGKTEEIQELEHIFPELAESEERIRKKLISITELYYGNNTGEQEKKNVLAWLERQKCDSANANKMEWSEEDECMLKSLIGWMDGNFGVTHERKKKYIKWLKNKFVKLHPKPHWKPSEEQMDALQSLMFFKNKLGPSATGAALDSLYEQLKQL